MLIDQAFPELWQAVPNPCSAQQTFLGAGTHRLKAHTQAV
jgi:hypothetical protein